jgi:hypothetical protein
MREGLDYFPLDTDYFNDEKVTVLKAEKGLLAVFVYLHMLSCLYRVGMCFRWDSLAQRAFCGVLGLKQEEVNSYLTVMLEVGLFSKEVFDSTGYLTSKGIQRRYLSVCENCNRKGTRIPSGVMLLTPDEIPSGVRVEEKESNKEREEIILKKSILKQTPNKPPFNSHLIPISSPINPQETPNERTTPIMSVTLDDCFASSTAEIKTSPGKVAFSQQGPSATTTQEPEIVVEPARGFNGLEPRNDKDGYRRVGEYAGLDSIAYEQFCLTSQLGAEGVDRALLLVEGWVQDGVATRSVDIETRKRRAANCSGILTSWALSKAAEQLLKEKRAKGNQKKTVNEKLMEIAAL